MLRSAFALGTDTLNLTHTVTYLLNEGWYPGERSMWGELVRRRALRSSSSCSNSLALVQPGRRKTRPTHRLLDVSICSALLLLVIMTAPTSSIPTVACICSNHHLPSSPFSVSSKAACCAAARFDMMWVELTRRITLHNSSSHLNSLAVFQAASCEGCVKSTNTYSNLFKLGHVAF